MTTLARWYSVERAAGWSTRVRVDCEDAQTYGERPAIAFVLQTARAVVDRSGRDGVRVRLLSERCGAGSCAAGGDSADAQAGATGKEESWRCTRPLYAAEARADCAGDALAGVALSALIDHVAGRTMRSFYAGAASKSWHVNPARWAMISGAFTAMRCSVLAAIAAPLAWYWRHWAAVLRQGERSHGDGSPRWPRPERSGADLLQMHAFVAVGGPVFFGTVGGVLDGAADGAVRRGHRAALLGVPRKASPHDGCAPCRRCPRGVTADG